MNQQREVIYRQRRDLLMGEDVHGTIEEMIFEKSEEIAAGFADERVLAENWDHKGISDAVFKRFNTRLAPLNQNTLDGLNQEGLAQEIYDQCRAAYADREKLIGKETIGHLERVIMLQTVDNLWKDHLLSMDHLKEGVGLRGYAQQNPLLVYKKEGFEMFQDLIERVKDETLGILFRVQLAEPQSFEQMQREQDQELVYSGGDTGPAKKKPQRRTGKKVGRNDPCPCGSGKKYKKCCGR
jgi:preprotein translocase subunit SecA